MNGRMCATCIYFVDTMFAKCKINALSAPSFWTGCDRHEAEKPAQQATEGATRVCCPVCASQNVSVQSYLCGAAVVWYRCGNCQHTWG